MRMLRVTVHSYILVGRFYACMKSACMNVRRERQSMSIVSFGRDNELQSSGEPRSGGFANGASEL